MPNFDYLGKERNGKLINGTIEAANKEEAINLLSLKGLTPIKVSQIKTGLGNINIGGRVKQKEKIILTRQIATLINAGIPIAQSFSIIEKQIGNPLLKGIVSGIGKDLQGGSSLADALKKHPKVFGEVFVNMIAAGETSGNLDETLERLADQMEKDAATIGKVKGALIYPATILTAAIGAIIFLMIKVVPQIAGIFSESGEQLPFNTRLLLGISNILRDYIFLLIIGGTGAALVTNKVFLKQEKTKMAINRFLLKLPLIKDIIIKLNIARFSRTLASLLKSGIPVIQAFEIVSGSLSSPIFKKDLEIAKGSIKNGQRISDSLKQCESFPLMVTEMISVGEETGNIEAILEKLADFHEKELESLIANLSSVLEPLIMVLLGGAIGFIVMSILQPIYQMSEMI
jgi:type IV pilus assembly protein PilC